MEARIKKLKESISEKTKLVKTLKKEGNDTRAFQVYKELDVLKKEKALIDGYNKIKA